MKILVTGSTGLVGSRFVELSEFKNSLLLPNESEMDITSADKVKEYFSQNNPDAVIHFAAFTNVAEGENQRDDKGGLCWKINVDGTQHLLNAIDKNKTHFIQISTDYVFSGSKETPGPYAENHAVDLNSGKLTWYGYTKAMAEQSVKDMLGDKGTILRINYPVRAKFSGKADYLRKPLKLFDEGKLYPMFADQQVSFALIDEIAVTLDKLLNLKLGGIFHASSSDTTSPFDAISYLIEKARGKTNVVQKSSLTEFLKTANNPVRYPQFGGLSVEQTQEKLGIKFRSWKAVIDELVKQGIEV